MAQHALSQIDGRTRAARLLRRTRAELVQHLGGAPSAVQSMAIERCAMLSLHVAQMDQKALAAGGMSDHARREYLAADASLRRTLQFLGIDGKAQRQPTITELMQRPAA